jgi:hypothetical protein
MLTKQDVPTVECQPVPTRFDTPQWKFWCKHCRAWHHHGGHVEADGTIGHRLAHCHKPGSPYQKTGYFLRPAARFLVGHVCVG